MRGKVRLCTVLRDMAMRGKVRQGKARNQRKLYIICLKYSFSFDKNMIRFFARLELKE